MKGSAGSLETSNQNNQPNSQADNSAKQPAEDVRPKSLADIFKDTSDESSTEIALDDDESDDPSKPIDSIDKLIKRHKLTPEQAYSIKVPMANGGEPLTIGALKDRIGELQEFELRETAFDERRISQEGELLRAQQELHEMLGMLPKESIKPEVWESLRKRQNAVSKREVQLTMQHIPEWSDESRRTTDINGMIDMLSDYGFPPSFINSLQDHRALKFVRDTFIMRSRIKKSLESVRDPAKKAGTRPSGKTKAAMKPFSANTKAPKFPTQADKIAQFFKDAESN